LLQLLALLAVHLGLRDRLLIQQTLLAFEFACGNFQSPQLDRE